MQTVAFAPSRLMGRLMPVLHPSKKRIKRYPHFDPLISIEEAEAYAADPEKVARHAFYPFIEYKQGWTRFAKKGVTGDRKDRDIRYASRQDGAIYTQYRAILSKEYETELRKFGLENNVLAYRRVPEVIGGGNKCNIHFARDAFQAIRSLGDCCAIALDISKFFECLDHDRVKELWCRLLRMNKLPPDHFHVFNAITKYATVNKIDVYEALNHFGPKKTLPYGKVISGYLTNKRDMPTRLCSGKEFRDKIAHSKTKKSIIYKHYKSYGVPQGAPISDLLANIYMIDFDKELAWWAKELGGVYFRYSDDILFIAPVSEPEGASIAADIRRLITEYGRHLIIKESKTYMVMYSASGAFQTFRPCDPKNGKNGLEYLGFRYDGRHAYIRNSTISSLLRKTVMASRRMAMTCARRYPNKEVSDIKKIFSYEALLKKYGKVEGFKERSVDYKNWTFWTYVRRASEVMGPLGLPIIGQLRKYRAFAVQTANIELERAVRHRDSRKAAAASS